MGKKIPLTKGNAKEWDQHPLCGTKIQPGNPAAKQASNLTENSPKGSVALDTSGSVRKKPKNATKKVRTLSFVPSARISWKSWQKTESLASTSQNLELMNPLGPVV